MTREKALGWARMLASIGDPQTTIEQIACVVLATEAQTAARCAEILQRGIDANRLLPPGIRNETGVAEIARNEIIREFPIVNPPGANGTPQVKESGGHPPSVALRATPAPGIMVPASAQPATDHLNPLATFWAKRAETAEALNAELISKEQALLVAIRDITETLTRVETERDELRYRLQAWNDTSRVAELQSHLAAVLLAGEPFERAVRNIERQEPFWVMLTSQNIHALAAALEKAREVKP